MRDEMSSRFEGMDEEKLMVLVEYVQGVIDRNVVSEAVRMAARDDMDDLVRALLKLKMKG